ncbi:MAG: hypothetical protein NT171_15255 [Planctomycetota bacterium]|nr:hypothetical protein [Actinomycetota bacterium]MCY3016027.1 hypothetical protein [Planctomycetota bacterium]
MKNLFKKSSPVAWFLLGVLIAGGTGTAYAANGGTFRLGQSNSATATTKLTNTKGTALKVISKAGTPPINVGTNSTKVPNFNADKLDGLSSASFVRGKIYFAEVNADATLHRGSAGVTTERAGIFGGGYQVNFPQNISSCFGQVSIGYISDITPTPAFIIGQSQRNNGTPLNYAVYVNVQDTTGAPQDAKFTLMVSCL